ncbi:hypothetical protein ACFYU9_22035 [Streptomyces sp. NPDC004327]|uniref:hypothetical protein n=1 Tax=unclassified Streptomyces TaxID=2593676 RepID=UPI00369F8D73
MGRWNDYLGTRHPDGATAPLPPPDVHRALLALNGTGVPFLVRAGTGPEGDLVAECRLPQLRVRLLTRMRLAPDTHEVRALDERVELNPSTATRAEYSRGPANTVYRVWGITPGPDGRPRRVETFRFDTRSMKDPLRQAVLDAGWTWRGVLLRL